MSAYNQSLIWLEKIDKLCFSANPIIWKQEVNSNGKIEKVIESPNIYINKNEYISHLMFCLIRGYLCLVIMAMAMALFSFPYDIEDSEALLTSIIGNLIALGIFWLLFWYIPYRISNYFKKKTPATGLILFSYQLAAKETMVRNMIQTKVKAGAELINNKIQDAKTTQVRQKQLLDNESILAGYNPIPCLVQGGAGLNFSTGSAVFLTCRSNSIGILNLKTEESLTIPFEQLTLLEIDGPGKVKASAGLSGGGFGAEAAVEGILVASVVNALTTVSAINTYLKVGFLNQKRCFISNRSNQHN